MIKFNKRTLLIALIGLLVTVPFVGKAATMQELQTQIQALLQQVQQLQAQLAQQQGGGQSWCHTFDTNLKIGDSTSERDGTGDTMYLQQALTKEGFSINSTEYNRRFIAKFGESTAAAVTGFQEKYRDEILTPNGLSNGTGYVGKSTRAKLNQLYGCGGDTVRNGWLSIQPSNITIKIGETVQVQAMYQPPMPPCPVGMACKVMSVPYPVQVTWTSSDSKIATVRGTVIAHRDCPPASYCPVEKADFSTMVTGVGIGTAELKAIYSSPSGGVITATAKVSVTNGTTIAPQINSISPQSGPVGMQVALTGSGFTPDMAVVCITYPCNPIGTNTVHFGPATISSVRSYDGETLYFQVPGGYTPPCTSDGACPMNAISINGQLFFGRISPGTYNVSVTNANGASNSVSFTVTSSERSIIQVISPNGGETWSKGTTQTIKWQDNTPYPVCPVGAACSSVARTVDLKLVLNYPVCPPGAGCPAYYLEPYTIAENVYGSSYNWSTGKVQNIYSGDGTVSDGSYMVQVCQSVTNICDSSDSYFNIVSGSNSPYLGSVYPSTGPVGTKVEIKGSGFANQDTVVWLDKGYEKGILWSGVPSDLNATSPNLVGAVKIDATILARLCSDYTCSSSMEVTPGIYKIYVQISGGLTSNAVNFTVTSSANPFIQVLSPNGGEVWQLGISQVIRWRMSSATQVTAFLADAKDASRSWKIQDIYISQAGENAFPWTVGQATPFNNVSGVPPSGSYYVEVCQRFEGSKYENCDYSDVPFSIVQ